MKYLGIIIKLLSIVITIVITIVVVKACFPEKAALDPAPVATDARVILIPMQGIPNAYIKHLRESLEEMHGFDIRVTVEMGKGENLLLNGRKQLDAEQIFLATQNIREAYSRGSPYFIVLTNEDLNYKDSGLRFTYSVHYYEDEVSIISLARINPANVGILMSIFNVPSEYNTMMQRTLKLVNKAIGYGVYNYRASSNEESVMYSPIMGIHDLDRVGSWY